MRQVSTGQAHSAAWRNGVATCLLAVVVAIAPVKSAHAYVDPNSVGPLYQFLFPVIIAITSTIAGLRRSIARVWNRLTRPRTADVQAEPAGADSEQHT
jgi:hypothetical protein